jgi:hypothetical protein
VTQGGNQARVHSDQMALVVAKQGGWSVMRCRPKTLKAMLNLKRLGLSPLRSNGFMVTKKGGWTTLTVAKDVQGKIKTQFLEAKGPT